MCFGRFAQNPGLDLLPAVCVFYGRSVFSSGGCGRGLYENNQREGSAMNCSGVEARLAAVCRGICAAQRTLCYGKEKA